MQAVQTIGMEVAAVALGVVDQDVGRPIGIHVVKADIVDSEAGQPGRHLFGDCGFREGVARPDIDPEKTDPLAIDLKMPRLIDRHPSVGAGGLRLPPGQAGEAG